MAVYERGAAEFAAQARLAAAPEWSRPDRPSVVVVPYDELCAWHPQHALHDVLQPHLAAVVVALADGDPTHRLDARFPVDIVAGDESQLDAIVTQVHSQPVASTAFVQVLRRSEARDVHDGLALESAVYSTLLGGPEFAAWRRTNPPRPRRADDGPPVHVSREGATLRVSLQRPQVHNALNTAMRDQLLEAFTLATLDDSIEAVAWSGTGPSFCSGGDLDEFGTFDDVASAHLVRLWASLGRVLHALAPKVEVRLHGACMGSGCELAAFAAQAVVDDDLRVALPELAMGLIPGAGGTWSLPRRIGRHRTAWLGLTGRSVGAEVVQAWGLAHR